MIYVHGLCDIHRVAVKEALFVMGNNMFFKQKHKKGMRLNVLYYQDELQRMLRRLVVNKNRVMRE